MEARYLRESTGTISGGHGEKKEDERLKDERTLARVASRAANYAAAAARGPQGTKNWRQRGRERGIAQGDGRGREVNGGTGHGRGNSGPGPGVEPDARG